jgi:hypothetical protein
VPSAVGSRRWRRRPVHIPTPLTGGPGTGRRSGAACAGPGARGRPQETASKAVRTSSSVMPISGALRRRRLGGNADQACAGQPGQAEDDQLLANTRNVAHYRGQPHALASSASKSRPERRPSIAASPPAQSYLPKTAGGSPAAQGADHPQSLPLDPRGTGPPSVRLPVVRPRSFAPAQPHRTRGSLAERCSQQATQPL